MEPTNTQKHERLAYSIEEVSQTTSLSKAYLRNQIRTGRLKATRCGRRVLVLHENLTIFLSESDGKTEATSEHK